MARLLNLSGLKTGLKNYSSPLASKFLNSKFKGTASHTRLMNSQNRLGSYVRHVSKLSPRGLATANLRGARQLSKWWNAEGVKKDVLKATKFARRSFAVSTGLGVVGLSVGAIYSTNRLLHRRRRRY